MNKREAILAIKDLLRGDIIYSMDHINKNKQGQRCLRGTNIYLRQPKYDEYFMRLAIDMAYQSRQTGEDPF